MFCRIMSSIYLVCYIFILCEQPIIVEHHTVPVAVLQIDSHSIQPCVIFFSDFFVYNKAFSLLLHCSVTLSFMQCLVLYVQWLCVCVWCTCLYGVHCRLVLLTTQIYKQIQFLKYTLLILYNDVLSTESTSLIRELQYACGVHVLYLQYIWQVYNYSGVSPKPNPRSICIVNANVGSH